MSDQGLSAMIEEPAAEAPAGEDFLEGFSDPATRSYMARKGFRNVESLGASFASLERMMSANGRFPLPTDDADQEGWNRAFAALGRPESAADYGFGDLAGADTDFSGKAAEWLFEAGVGQARAQALAEKWNAYVAERGEADRAAFQAQSAAELDDLRVEWGPKFEANTEAFRRGARTFGLSAEEMDVIEGGLGTRRTMELFARIGQALAEDGFIAGDSPGTFGMTREQAESRIAALQRDQAWQARWMSGGADERAEWTKLTRIAGS